MVEALLRKRIPAAFQFFEEDTSVLEAQLQSTQKSIAAKVGHFLVVAVGERNGVGHGIGDLAMWKVADLLQSI